MSRKVVITAQESAALAAVAPWAIGPALETRTCACECGLTFRCLPASRQIYASLHCQAAEAEGRGGKIAAFKLLQSAAKKRGGRRRRARESA